MRERERKKGRHDEGQYSNRESDEHLGIANHSVWLVRTIQQSA